jgi:hypothetical protein
LFEPRCNQTVYELTVEARSGDGAWWGESLAIFAYCFDLALLIGSVTVKYCPRGANKVPQELG